jgi:cytochrome oxidase assembly protein ShyY1
VTGVRQESGGPRAVDVLVTPRWFGLAAVCVLLAAAMVGLGIWQLHRYHERSTVNARIDAGGTAVPVPLATRAPAPGGRAGSVGPAPRPDAEWTRVSASGGYDESNEVLVRGRTSDGVVGFEVVTPLVLADGSAVLIDRGWMAAPEGDAATVPKVPAAPVGQVSVAGRLHLAESWGGAVQRQDGRLEVRRIDPTRLSAALPYPLYNAYITLDTQDPPATGGLTPIPPDHQNALQNAAYVVQWWMFAGIALFGFGYLARREVQQQQGSPEPTPIG